MRDKTIGRKGERGAALATVLMITVLLGIACVFLLKAASATSGETSDVLAETKAYYSAEAGIQATINVLRNNATLNHDYIKAVDPSTSNSAGDPSSSGSNSFGRLSNYLSYLDATKPDTNPNGRVLVDPTNTSPQNYQAFSVKVLDPDETQVGVKFTGSMPATVAPAASPSPGTPSSTVIMPATQTSATFSAGPIPVTSCTPLGPITLTNSSGGVTAAQTVDSHIDYHLDVPPPTGATRSIYVQVAFNAGGTQATITSKSSSNLYSLAGSQIWVYTDSSCTENTNEFESGGASLVLTPGIPKSLYLKVTPIQPFRLQLLSTGFGPSGAMKKLETVIERNLFNNLASGASLAMIGPSAGMIFKAGNSANVEYNGTDPTTGASVPSIGVTTTGGLGVVTDPNNWPNNPKTQPNPPPAIMSDSPDWQSSPSALDTYLNGEPLGLKAAAQKAGTYYTTNAPSSVGTCIKDGSGNLIGVSGITFVNAAYNLTGTNNCGILVVTGGADHSGGLVLKGNFSFTGLIIVTGANGVTRSGAGNGSIIGNIVIAPYNAASLATNTWLPPKYDMSGGGTSDVTYSGLSVDFDGQTSISDFVLGVAEK